MTDLALVEHGLEFALIASVDTSAEELGGALGAADQHAQFTGTLEQGVERCRAFEHDVSR